MNSDTRLCVLEAATQRELEDRVADMEKDGWRAIDGKTIASPTREVPHWVQVLYHAPKPLPLEVIRVNPDSFNQRNRPPKAGGTD